MSSTLARCATALLIAGAALGEEQPGVSDRSILFGQSAAFSGSAQELGRNMRLGMQAAFREVNEQGGVHGRRLELVSLDDGYEPEAAIDNTRQLIEGERGFRADRRRRHPNLARNRSHCRGRRRPLHRSLHGQ